MAVKSETSGSSEVGDVCTIALGLSNVAIVCTGDAKNTGALDSVLNYMVQFKTAEKSFYDQRCLLVLQNNSPMEFDTNSNDVFSSVNSENYSSVLDSASKTCCDNFQS